MTLDELMERAPALRKNGVLRVRVGDLEVHFAPINPLEELVRVAANENGVPISSRDDADTLDAWSMPGV